MLVARGVTGLSVFGSQIRGEANDESDLDLIIRLAAGLIWGLALGGPGYSIKIFFLACIITAGIFGAMTVSPKIFFVQALPAVVALGMLIFG